MRFVPLWFCRQAHLHQARILWTLYRQKRDIEGYLDSTPTTNRTQFTRLFAVGLLDIIFTLPTGIAFTVTETLYSLELSPTGTIPFYPGWYYTHHQWAPVLIPISGWTSPFWYLFGIYYDLFLYPVFSLTIFLLFVLTASAREKYRRWFWTVASLIGVKPPVVCDDYSDMAFESRPHRLANTSTRYD